MSVQRNLFNQCVEGVSQFWSNVSFVKLRSFILILSCVFFVAAHVISFDAKAPFKQNAYNGGGLISAVINAAFAANHLQEKPNNNIILSSVALSATTVGFVLYTIKQFSDTESVAGRVAPIGMGAVSVMGLTNLIINPLVPRLVLDEESSGTSLTDESGVGSDKVNNHLIKTRLDLYLIPGQFVTQLLAGAMFSGYGAHAQTRLQQKHLDYMFITGGTLTVLANAAGIYAVVEEVIKRKLLLVGETDVQSTHEFSASNSSVKRGVYRKVSADNFPRSYGSVSDTGRVSVVATTPTTGQSNVLNRISSALWQSSDSASFSSLDGNNIDNDYHDPFADMSSELWGGTDTSSIV